jgi:hypothetical protein
MVILRLLPIGREFQTPAERRRLFLVVGIACLVSWFFMAGFLLLLYWYYGLEPDWELVSYVLGWPGAIFGIVTALYYSPRPKNGEGTEQLSN